MSAGGGGWEKGSVGSAIATEARRSEFEFQNSPGARQCVSTKSGSQDVDIGGPGNISASSGFN